MAQIPEYIPFLPEVSRKFYEINNASLEQKELRETSEKLLESALEFLEQIVDTPYNPGDEEEDDERQEPLWKVVQAFDMVTRSIMESEVFSNVFKKTKSIIQAKIGSEAPLSLSNIDQLAKVDVERNMFSKMLRNKLEEADDRLARHLRHNTNPDYVYLKQAAFIIDHPLDPLPDENAGEDDDIQVEGGKIDLVCPLSMKMFENPMISSICGHTFDQEGIRGIWTNGAQACPIPGCRKRVSYSDFEKDRLMILRVKSYRRLQKRLDNDQNLERI